MNNNLNIYIIDSDPTISSELKQKVNGLRLGSCNTALPSLPIDELATLDPNLAILGPSLDKDTCLKCIHKFKIIDSFMPVLTSCADLFLPEGPDITPFHGIYSISQTPEPDEVISTIEKALKEKDESEQASDYSMLIGQSWGMIDIRQKIRTMSNKDVTLLITGETGTGKELIARSIHFHSERNKEPLVKINCVALPDELLESEVFGFQKGAFTGAHKNKPGLLELADGGTLFIDEIGALSLSPQAKFLQVLEDKAFSRLGGLRDKKLDIRIVAATNADLRGLVRDGTFRKDLYYRLNIMNIHVSPLRERKEDIPLLIHYLLNKYCFELKKKILKVPDNISSFFLSYHWPGNVRELENVVRRAIVLRDWEFIYDELNSDESNPEGEHLIPSFADSLLMNWTDVQMKKLFEDKEFSLKKISKAYVSEAERLMILKTLRETDWNRKKAAQKLQVSYKTLLNRIEEFKLKP
jgi:two-component system response regulator AtoC